MNFCKKYYILLILLITTAFVKFILFYNNDKNKNVKELNNQVDRIANCIDIENKNKRTSYENLRLSEYCIHKFGSHR